MSTASIPYTFSPGTIIASAQVNADFSTIYGLVNGNIDNTNIGAAGIFASQLVPTTGPQATFGGSQNYTFNNTLNMLSGSFSGIMTATLAYGNNSTTALPFRWNGNSGTVYLGASSGLSLNGVTSSAAVLAFNAQPLMITDTSGNTAFNGALSATPTSGGITNVPAMYRMTNSNSTVSAITTNNAKIVFGTYTAGATGTVTVTMTGLNFTAFTVIVQDFSGNIYVPASITSYSPGTFTFSATNTHVYQWTVVGY